ncbi:hypothetical protein OAE79_01640 [Rhodopirellula sp.]|nr:hypothetical protein [Rhodopirellula sp.]MDB4679017.1 hypothetical protein [Rhodopirellula sp.]
MAAFAISAMIIAAILRFTPPIENKLRRKWLIRLRLLASLILLLSLFRPTIVKTEDELTDASLIVAVDVSQSMTLPDGQGQTRWESQRKIWQTLATQIEPTSQNLKLQLLAYGDETKKLPEPSIDSLNQQKSLGQLTNIPKATLSAFQASRGQPLAGVILIGDGTQTAITKNQENQRVTETLRGLGVPLWTIPIGRTPNNGPPRDIAIEAMPESLQLFAGNEASVSFQVATRSLSGIEIPLQISWIDQQGNEKVFATRNVVPSTASDVIGVTLPLLTPQAGSYQLKVEATATPDELITSNNIQRTFVDVRDGGGRILYLEGAASLEQTFLRRALRRFPDLDLQFQWIPIDSKSSWPVELQSEFIAGKYDIYILGDLHSSALGQQQIEQLEKNIADGAGLLTLGGLNAYESGGYGTTQFANILPVQLRQGISDTGPLQSFNETLNKSLHLNDPVSIELSQLHPITDLGGQEISERWQQLPQLLGANIWSSAKARPGVTTLLETPNQVPLMVIGEYGNGRVASVAFDSTWRWWRAGKSEIHRKFWRQTMLWLLSRDNFNDDELMIELESRRFAVDRSSEFRLTTSDPTNQSFGDSVSLTLSGPDQDKQTLLTVPEMKQGQMILKGSLENLQPGIYQLTASSTSDTNPVKSTKIAFEVVANSKELSRPAADPDYLAQLANLTAPYGGGVYRPDQINDLIDQIKQQRQNSETTIVRSHRLGDDPLSGWILFTIFFVAMSTEWTLRRRWGLA